MRNAILFLLVLACGCSIDDKRILESQAHMVSFREHHAEFTTNDLVLEAIWAESEAQAYYGASKLERHMNALIAHRKWVIRVWVRRLRRNKAASLDTWATAPLKLEIPERRFGLCVTQRRNGVPEKENAVGSCQFGGRYEDISSGPRSRTAEAQQLPIRTMLRLLDVLEQNNLGQEMAVLFSQSVVEKSREGNELYYYGWADSQSQSAIENVHLQEYKQYPFQKWPRETGYKSWASIAHTTLTQMDARPSVSTLDTLHALMIGAGELSLNSSQGGWDCGHGTTDALVVARGVRLALKRNTWLGYRAASQSVRSMVDGDGELKAEVERKWFDFEVEADRPCWAIDLVRPGEQSVSPSRQRQVAEACLLQQGSRDPMAVDTFLAADQWRVVGDMVPRARLLEIIDQVVKTHIKWEGGDVQGAKILLETHYPHSSLMKRVVKQINRQEM